MNVRSLLMPFARHLPLQRLIRASGQRLLLPFYHAVTDERAPHLRHLYPVRTVRQFRSDLEFLLRHYHPITPAELLEHVHGKPLRQSSFLLTFDDGLREVQEVVAPILAEYGLPAVLFVCPEFTQNRHLFHRHKASQLMERLEQHQPTPATEKELLRLLTEQGISGRNWRQRLLNIRYPHRHLLDELAQVLEVDFQAFLQEERPYLTLPELQALAGQHITMGAHSMDHPEYYLLPLEEQLRQTQQSAAWAQQHLQPQLLSFAFPFTDFRVGRRWFEAVYSGEQPLDLSFGGAGLKADVHPHHLQRLGMETGRTAQETIAAEYLYYLLKAPLGKNRMQR